MHFRNEKCIFAYGERKLNGAQAAISGCLSTRERLDPTVRRWLAGTYVASAIGVGTSTDPR